MNAEERLGSSEIKIPSHEAMKEVNNLPKNDVVEALEASLESGHYDELGYAGAGYIAMSGDQVEVTKNLVSNPAFKRSINTYYESAAKKSNKRLIEKWKMRTAYQTIVNPKI